MSDYPLVPINESLSLSGLKNVFEKIIALGQQDEICAKSLQLSQEMSLKTNGNTKNNVVQIQSVIIATPIMNVANDILSKINSLRSNPDDYKTFLENELFKCYMDLDIPLIKAKKRVGEGYTKFVVGKLDGIIKAARFLKVTRGYISKLYNHPSEECEVLIPEIV